MPTFDAARFPDLVIEDIPIGSGTIVATLFTGISSGPAGQRWIFARKAREQIPIDWGGLSHSGNSRPFPG